MAYLQAAREGLYVSTLMPVPVETYSFDHTDQNLPDLVSR
jgi:hypothetical protein